jgi:hypothetical protein
MERRKRRSPFDLFDFSSFKEVERLFEESWGEFERLGSHGYSITVTQTGKKTIVRAKVGRDVDVGRVREELQRSYPGAEIIIEGGKPLIREVKEEEET